MTLLFLLALTAIALWLLRTSYAKGFFGEKKVQIASGLFLNSGTYHRIDNVILPVHNGTTQIDHVVISIYGVFVIETKNMKGWIFGGENWREWTQTIYHDSYRFQNPLRQNFLHVKAVEAVLEIPRRTIQSVVVFPGDAEFKTEMPDNVIYMTELPRYVRSYDQPVFTEEECESFIERIDEARLSPSFWTGRMHVRNLKDRFSAESENICPRCGSTLVVRTAKNGRSKGEQFLGCSAYPKCKYTSAIT